MQNDFVFQNDWKNTFGIHRYILISKIQSEDWVNLEWFFLKFDFFRIWIVECSSIGLDMISTLSPLGLIENIKKNFQR